VLEPRADGFRNYARAGEKAPLEQLLVERAYLLGVTAPELTVLIGGLRASALTTVAPSTVCSPPSRAC